MTSLRVAGAVALAMAGSAQANIAYDNLSGQPHVGTLIYGQSEVAQDVHLAPGAGLQISSLAIRFRNPTSNLDDSGTITLSLYADEGGQPGALLASDTQTFQLPRDSTGVYYASFAPFLAPGPDLWAAWFVQSPLGGVTGVDFGGQPFVGATTDHYVHRFDGAGAWIDGGQWDYDPFQIQVLTAPAPSTLALALLAGLGSRRRR